MIETTQTVTAATLAWGYKGAQLAASAIWGCRAILDERCHPPLLDIVWDRQSTVGDETAAEELHAQLNAGALDALRAWVAAGEWEDEAPAIVHLGGIVFHVLPRAGYLYVAAALDTKES